MTDAHGDTRATESKKFSHGESHASMSDEKSRRKSRIDSTGEFPQVAKSRAAKEKSRRTPPRKVTFSALSLGRAERDAERGGDQQNPSAQSEPEPVGPIAEQLPDDLAARQRAALNRLTRAHKTTR